MLTGAPRAVAAIPLTAIPIANAKNNTIQSANFTVHLPCSGDATHLFKAKYVPEYCALPAQRNVQLSAMKPQNSTTTENFEAVDSGFMLKIFYCFLALAGMSVLISFAGKQLGQSIAMAGHTDDTTLREIVIGNNVLSVPSNEIRFEHERLSGVTARLDTYLRWPTMTGYTDEARADFNHVNQSRNIVFVSFRERTMSRDMSGRMEPIYSSLIVKPGIAGPGETTLYGFREKSGYLNEVLAVGESGTGQPFVARCLTGNAAESSLAPCERDIHLGDNLSMTYRFPARLLRDWKSLDANMSAYAASRLKTIR